MTRSIAVLGTNGVLGEPTLKALASNEFKKHFSSIKAVTRGNPSTKIDGVEYIIGDIVVDPEYVASKLKGVDAIVSLLAPSPPIESGVLRVLELVNPELYIPSQFGTDLPLTQKYLPGFLEGKTIHSKEARKLVKKVVDIANALFIKQGSFGYESVLQWGIESNGSVIQKGAPSTPVSVTDPRDVGKVIASLVSKSDYSKIPDTVRVESDQVTFADVQKTWANNHKKQIKVVEELTKEQALKELQSVWAQGFNPSKFPFYLQGIASQGPGSGLTHVETENEFVNPKESLWTWEKFDRNL